MNHTLDIRAILDVTANQILAVVAPDTARLVRAVRVFAPGTRACRTIAGGHPGSDRRWNRNRCGTRWPR